MGSGTLDPLRGGLFSFGGSIQQSCGLLRGEERRPPGALGRSEASLAWDFAFLLWAAAFSRAAGYCTEKSEGHRRPWGAARRQASPARDFAFHPPTLQKREKERETTYHTGYISLAERVTQRVPRGGFGRIVPPMRCHVGL